MGLGGIAAAIGAAAAVASTAYSIANAPGMPQSPNLAQATREGVLADAQALPYRRQLEAAAALGRSVAMPGYAKLTDSQTAQFKRALESSLQTGHYVTQGSDGLTYDFNHDQIQGMLDAISKGGDLYMGTNGQVVPHSQAYADFTGMGQGQVQGEVAKQNAANQLALSQKYDPQFIAEALKQEQEADPQGFAARQKEYDLIQQQLNEKPDRPVATELDKQVGAQLSAGNKLTPMEDSILQDEVAKAQAARGQTGTDAEQFADPLTTGFAGEARQQAANQKALGWLSSGATPEDVQYRREQQNLANLGAFVGGKSPQSQFQSLSGAQQGPTPTAQAQLSGMPQSGGQSGQQYALAGWQTQLGAQMNQANPWMAGLSTLLQGANVAANAGWKPLGGG